MTNVAPSLEIAYTQLRPLFLQALAKLSGQGFVVHPVDGMDLIHEFFVQAWDGVTGNYDPSKGPFEKYVFVAFVHFARPLIVKNQRLRESLMDYEAFTKLVDQRLPVPPAFESLPDLDKVGAGLHALPSTQRDILSAYFGADEASERALARRLGLSRYRLRELLISGLGKVMVSLDKPRGIGQPDWEVAIGLWKDEKSLQQTARGLGMTVHQVKEANSRNMRFLSSVLKNVHSSADSEKGRRVMGTRRYSREVEPARETDSDVHFLLARALTSPGDESLLDAVRENAAAILQAIDETPDLGATDELLEEVDSSWLGRVYDALSGTEGQLIEDEEVFYATADKESSIGTAFEQALMEGLPRSLRRFDALAHLAELEDDYVAELMETPSARAAGAYGHALALRGLTPLTIFLSADAVSGLVDRLVEQELIPRASVELAPSSVAVQGEHNEELTFDLVVDEIGAVASCAVEAAAGVYKWLIGAAEYKPLVFPRYRCEPLGRREGVKLKADDITYENLFQRWSLS